MTSKLEGADADLLLAFDALLRERNITRAARRLGIGQPAMSARLARLRALFDDQLFVTAANGRGIVPTDRAHAVSGPLSDVLDGLRQLLSTAAPFDPAFDQRVFCLAMHDNPAMMLAPSLLERLAAVSAGVSTVLVLPDARTIADDLETGRIDILVGPPELAQPQWIGRPLLADHFVTAQRKGHPRGTDPLTLDMFCAMDHLLISAGGHGRSGMVDQALAQHGRGRRIAASIQSYSLAPFIIAQTDMICTLPSTLFGHFVDRLDLFAPPVELGLYDLRMFWHPRSRDDGGHVWLRELVAETACAIKA